MRTPIYDILRAEAARLGACDLYDKFTSSVVGARALFLPQVMEFCTEHGFPSISQWELIKHDDQQLYQRGILINFGKVRMSSLPHLALIGKTDATIECHGAKAFSILMMHGARATIKATGYAVVKIEKTHDCEISIINDSTAVIL